MSFLSDIVERLTGGSPAGTTNKSHAPILQKLDLFRASYGGKVYAELPANAMPHFYVRLEYRGGDTVFSWYDTEAQAAAAVAEMKSRSHPNTKAVLGPFPVPTGRSEQFR